MSGFVPRRYADVCSHKLKVGVWPAWAVGTGGCGVGLHNPQGNMKKLLQQERWRQRLGCQVYTWKFGTLSMKTEISSDKTCCTHCQICIRWAGAVAVHVCMSARTLIYSTTSTHTHTHTHTQRSLSQRFGPHNPRSAETESLFFIQRSTSVCAGSCASAICARGHRGLGRGWRCLVVGGGVAEDMKGGWIVG